MRIVYLITVIWAKYLYDKIEKKIQDRLSRDGYVEVEKKHHYFLDIIGEAICILVPILNVMFPLHFNKHFDEYYKSYLEDYLKEGKVRKLTEEDEIEYDEKYSSRLKINNILSAKSVEEENTPKWKKIIENLYYQVGNILKNKNIIESNQDEYTDEIINNHDKVKRL